MFFRRIDITLSDGELSISFDGQGSVPLIPMSHTAFGHPNGTYEFIKDARGTVAHIEMNGGQYRAVRRRWQ
jgi:hypothetical protein